MPPEPLAPALRVELDHRIHFAMQQNDVPVVKAVHIDNGSDVPVRELRVRITTEPEFAEPWETRVDLVGERSTYNLNAVDLILSPHYLGELTERVRGHLRVELLRGDLRVAERVEPVELLARDEWSGLASLPEILAAFVMPNHPAVERILRDAADVLQRWTGDPSLSGYQSKDRKRAYTMAAAIYAALQGLEIAYVNPPASFEAEGQRIRLPDRILESRLATCLDLAVLAAACLEQAGLHPLVAILKGHAFTGVWLQEECFLEPAIDDPLRLRKRVDLGEIAVFDPTAVAQRPSPDFETAVREAKRHLANPDDFRCVIDVARARKGRIRPLPERAERTIATPEESGAHRATAAPAPPDVSGVPAPGPPPASPGGEAPEAPTTRLERWRRRLLDLTLRNRLLNFRETKKTIPLLCSDLPALEDALAEGVAFQVLPRPRDLAEGDPRDPDAHRRRTGEEAVAALLCEELRAKRLYADLAPEELDRRLLEVYRAARLGIEEGGASALYLAVGFLAWYETPQSSERRLAPILLLPLELHRRSAREGFSLSLGDDEPRLNVTLLEMLKQDHDVLVPGLDPLPDDESGLDVPKILRTVRETIRDIDRWDVLEIARIGIFSFAKFLMWRDLAERAGDLMRNPVVDHLVNHPGEPFDGDSTFSQPNRLDEERSPLQTFCPVPADASQLAAVFAAAEGHSFVLEGPPGTGKSQTITNLIAHCLAEGKTVLFVSEKMAALNVVHDRLQKVGLGRSCLELHSNKAHKREVLAQLDAAMGHYDERTPEEWSREAQQLESLRNELNAYVQALHRRRKTGESVFQATSRLIGLRDAPKVELCWPSPDALDPDRLASLRDVVDRLLAAASALGEGAGHPWAAVGFSEWTPAWDREVRTALDRFREQLDGLAAPAREASARLSLAEENRWSLNQLRLLDELAEILLESPAPPTALLVRPDWEEVHSGIGSWIEHGRRRDALRAELFGRLSEKVLSLDLDSLETRLEQANASRWPASWWRRRRVRKALRSVAQEGKPPANEELGPLLEQARALRDEDKALTAAGDEARALLGRYWKNGEAAWDELERVREWARRLRSVAAGVAAGDLERAALLRERWARLATEGPDLLRVDGIVGRELLAYRSAHEAFYEVRISLERLLELNAERAWGADGDPDALGVAQRTLGGWLERPAELREWCAWRRARSEAVRADLAPLVEGYERSEFGSDDFQRAFDRGYYEWWYTAIVSSEPILATFFSPEHERKIDRFRETDDRYAHLTRQLIAARLGEKVPGRSAVALPGGEVGILKREIGKRRRHIPVRQLFHAIPNLLPRLKPCLLMSPMSVAQFLDASYPPFDLVVFDEASQIPVWDAVGAIARGKQAVIVGDPKQLPPTTFFQRSEDPDEEPTEAETVEDLESILGDCISAGLPVSRLDWHYRSRHESLIAFSNYHYYDNRLLTFPSPQREGMGVGLRPVPGGVYDRGKSATNRAEADAVVEEIVRRLRDQQLCRWSIGVVTFSQAQQTLIEDLIERVRLGDPELDGFFSEDAAEPIFVKNLENVQGDERDVILFSICYGPDALGRVAMNFGPMNREGGERRLNVAITRARREVLVFSTLRADQIDLARSRARGVRDLKNFLEYAERGTAAIAEAIRYDPEADFESPFEKAVHDALVERGWEVHPQVGCARYRIDLAVVDPEARGRYLLGIECDGANYHRARTARDRDKLREGILRGLGWQLHRLWSTDWWTNPKREIEKLAQALERARRGASGSTASGHAPVTSGAGAPGTSSSPASLTGGAPTLASSPAPRPPGGATALPRLPIYTPLRASGSAATSDDFYAPSSKRRIQRVICDVVAREGPIRLELAARRVAARWGLERIREKAIQHVDSLVPEDTIFVERSSAGVFLWPKDQRPETYTSFRVPAGDTDTLRDVDDLPIQEIANGALHLLRQHISAPEDELLRELARLFGYQRTGKLVQERMTLGIRYLIDQGRARRDDRGFVALLGC